MNLRWVAERVVELCNQGKNFDVMRTMYDPDLVSVEPTGKQARGKDAVIRKSEVWAAGVSKQWGAARTHERVKTHRGRSARRSRG